MDFKMEFQNGILTRDPEEKAQEAGQDLDEWDLKFIHTHNDFREKVSQDFDFQKELKKLISPSGRYELIKKIGFIPGYPVERIDDQHYYDTKYEKYCSWDRLSNKSADYLQWIELYRIFPNGDREIMDCFPLINMYSSFVWAEEHPTGYDYFISECNGGFCVVNLSTNTFLVHHLDYYAGEDLMLDELHISPNKQFLVLQIGVWAGPSYNQLWDFSHPMLYPYPILDDWGGEANDGAGWQDDTHFHFFQRDYYVSTGKIQILDEIWDVSEPTARVRNFPQEVVHCIKNNLPLSEFQKNYPYLRLHIGILSDICAMNPTNTATEVLKLIHDRLRVEIKNFDIIL